LKKGGKIGVMTWVKRGTLFLMKLMGRAMEIAKIGPPKPRPGALDLFVLGEKENMEGIMKGAGFTEVQLVEVSHLVPYTNESQLVEFLMGNPVTQSMMEHFSKDQMEDFKAALKQAASEMDHVMSGIALLAIATK